MFLLRALDSWNQFDSPLSSLTSGEVSWMRDMTKNVYLKTQLHFETSPLVPLIDCWACGVLACHVRWRAAGLQAWLYCWLLQSQVTVRLLSIWVLSLNAGDTLTVLRYSLQSWRGSLSWSERPATCWGSVADWWSSCYWTWELNL